MELFGVKSSIIFYISILMKW